MAKCKKFVLLQHFKEWPKESDLKIVEEELPPVKEGGKFILVKIHYGR